MTAPPSSGLGSRAPDFALPDLHGDTVRLADVRGERGTVIMFICNHCPYVRSVIGRIVEDSRVLLEEGVGVAAIMSNDHRAYPEDAPDNMRAFATEHALPFPYLLDESQSVARAYDAVCTPDFFGYNSDLDLRYRGRLDASKTTLVPDARRDLLEAMRQVAATGDGPTGQIPSMGCSIKWKSPA